MLERLWSQLGDLSVFAVISLVFGMIKTLLSPDPCPWHCQMITILLSVVLGTMAGGIAMQYHLGDYTSLAVCSAVSLVSRDIVMAILNNRQALGALLRMFLVRMTKKLTNSND